MCTPNEKVRFALILLLLHRVLWTLRATANPSPATSGMPARVEPTRILSKPEETKHSRTKHIRTKHNRTEQKEEYSAEQNRTEQNRTEQNRTEQKRTEQNREEQNGKNRFRYFGLFGLLLTPWPRVSSSMQKEAAATSCQHRD